MGVSRVARVEQGGRVFMDREDRQVKMGGWTLTGP